MAKVAIAPVFVLFLNVRGFLKEIIKLKGITFYRHRISSRSEEGEAGEGSC